MRRTPRRAAATARSFLLLESALPGVQPGTIKLRYEQRCVATNAARLRAATALVTTPAGWRMQLCLLAGIPSVLLAASGAITRGGLATQRIAINPKNHQCVCRLYEEVRLCNARGRGEDR